MSYIATYVIPFLAVPFSAPLGVLCQLSSPDFPLLAGFEMKPFS